MDNCTFVDAKNTVNFFDKSRVANLAQLILPLVEILWTKAKPEDIIALNEYTMWKLLEEAENFSVLTPSGRVDVCEHISKHLNATFTHRCKKRTLKLGRKPSAKQLEPHQSLFLQYASMMAFVIYGDLKQAYKLAELNG